MAGLQAFTAYMDESQDHQKRKVQCIGGLMAPAAEWNCIWGEWARLLCEYGLTEFHAKDCCAGGGEFARFTSDERDDIYADFFTIASARRGSRVAVGVTIMLEAYPSYAATLKYRRTLPPRSGVAGSLEDSYFLAFECAIQDLTTDLTVAGLPPNETIKFVFDRHHLSGRASGMYAEILAKQGGYRDRLGTLAFADSTKIVPLQVADLIAYEYRRYAHEVVIGKLPVRPSFVELVSRYGGGWRVDEGELRHLAHAIADNV